jgi:putative spermidine/putrescine transport system substrate-binding protein
MRIKKHFLFLLIILGLICCRNQKNLSEIVIASWGGGYQESQRFAIYEPFMKAYDVRIIEAKTEYGKLREMIEKENTSIDIADVESFFLYQAGSEGLLEPINFEIIDKEALIPTAANKYGVGAVVWSTILAYNKGITVEEPKSWKDLWDLKKFPGKRSLRDHPISTLEIALLADGVNPADIYPIDVARALKKLDEIKDKVIWWSDGDRPRQLLSSKEVAIASSWNGRIYAAIKDGQPLGICWNQGMMDLDWWVIPKGARNRDKIDSFLKYALGVEPQANQANYIAYGPTNKNAISKIKVEIIPFIPSAPNNIKNQFFIDSIWWSKNLDSIKEKWDSWKLK